MMPCCISTPISLLILLATAARAQEVGGNNGADLRNSVAKKEAKGHKASGNQTAAGTQSGGVAKHSVDRSDFKVLVWYRRSDPLGTFKYEIYDVRKGEYTAAVDGWIRNIEKNYPAYLVVVKGVDLKRERGETEMLKIGSVIKRELTVAAGMAGVLLDGGISVGSGPGLGVSHAPGPAASVGSLNRPLGSAGTDRSYLNPLPTPFPVPVPYPRPHP